MKKSLLSGFIVFSCSLFSQTTLTQAFHEPVAGDLESVYYLDTTAFSSGMPLNVTGNNATWNFTGLQAVPIVADSYYMSPSSVTNSASFPGCTFVQESGGFYTFFKSVTSPTTQTEILGITTNTLSLNFSNSAIATRYPVTYGTVSTDNLSGTFTFSVNGTCSGNITTSADGLGTLNLPGSSVPNVLRIKSVQNLTLSASIIPGLPATQVGTLKQTIYRFYIATQKFPILDINYTALSLITSSTPTVTGYAKGNISNFVVGLGENTLNKDISIYPNPASSVLKISNTGSSKIYSTELVNQLGQLVFKANTVEDIDLSHLDSGVYTFQIKTDKGILRKKIIKE